MSVAHDISSLLVENRAQYAQRSMPDAYERVMKFLGPLDREVPDADGAVEFLRSRYKGEKVAFDILMKQGIYHISRLRGIAMKKKDSSRLDAMLDHIVDSRGSGRGSDCIRIGEDSSDYFITSNLLSRNGFPVPERDRFDLVEPEDEPDDARLRRYDALEMQGVRAEGSGGRWPVFFAQSYRQMMNALLSSDEERYLFMKKEDLEKRLMSRCSRIGLGYEGLMALAYMMVERDSAVLARGRSRRSVDSVLSSVGKVVPLVRELDRIRGVVVYFNTRLVKSIAGRKYRGGSLTDLTQEGNFGLMRAYDLYDYRRGYKFSTFATWWIRHFIGRAMQQYGLGMHVPVHKRDFFKKVESVLNAAEADIEESALLESLGEVEYVCQRFDLDREKVRDVILQMKRARTVSLSTPIGFEGDSELIDIITDRSSPHPESAAAVSDIGAKIEVMLSWIDPRDAEVLRIRHGINGKGDATLAKVSELYPPGRNSSSEHLSRERIRQIEKRALRRLRRRLMFDERKLGAEFRAFLADVEDEKYNIFQGL